MISFLDYIKHFAELPEISGAIFSGSTAIASRFPKCAGGGSITQQNYYYASKDIEDMGQYGFVGFWKCLGDEEEVKIGGHICYKCAVVNPETEETVGFYYRYMEEVDRNRQFDAVEFNETIYMADTYGLAFKQGNTVYYQQFNKLANRGAFIQPYSILEKGENYLVVFEDKGWGANTDPKIVAYIDLENKKVIWSPNRNGGTWEDFKYVPGTDEKIISKDGSTSSVQANIKVFVDVDDEEFSNFQEWTNASAPIQYFVADYTTYTNTNKIQPTEEVIIDVPQKLIEKYSDNYTVKIFTITTSQMIMDALLFNFRVNDKEGEKTVVVIYHPSTRNWCEIMKKNYNAQDSTIGISELQTQDLRVSLNFVGQSVIDLDIYKKMADIGNGLMLFDDETEDLKYLYDTKNKELYNEYCDLVGTNAITFKK